MADSEGVVDNGALIHGEGNEIALATMMERLRGEVTHRRTEAVKTLESRSWVIRANRYIGSSTPIMH